MVFIFLNILKLSNTTSVIVKLYNRGVFFRDPIYTILKEFDFQGRQVLFL